MILYVNVLLMFSADICCPLTLGNGTVDCELGDNGGPNTGDTCSLSCDRGFIMEGSDSRMCIDSGTWTGDTTTCTARKCSYTPIFMYCTVYGFDNSTAAQCCRGL